jgi:hypothetical protein
MEYILVWRREERYRNKEANVHEMHVNTAHEDVEEEKQPQHLNAPHAVLLPLQLRQLPPR